MSDQIDPADGTPCEWPACTKTGNPYTDDGWVWYPRKYLWLSEGFFCPEHTAIMEEGLKHGDFDNWPLDTSPEVLEFQEALSQFHDIRSPKGQRILCDRR
jgi:hypothetical protein